MAKAKTDPAGGFRWEGDLVYSPGFGHLEPGRVYQPDDLPEGFEHPLLVPVNPAPVADGGKDVT